MKCSRGRPTWATSCKWRCRRSNGQTRCRSRSPATPPRTRWGRRPPARRWRSWEWSEGECTWARRWWPAKEGSKWNYFSRQFFLRFLHMCDVLKLETTCLSTFAWSCYKGKEMGLLSWMRRILVWHLVLIFVSSRFVHIGMNYFNSDFQMYCESNQNDFYTSFLAE